MKLQAKITLTLLLASLIATGTVAAVAYWSLMKNFRQSAKDLAFSNFQADLTDYLIKYGSMEEGNRYEPFDHFVSTRHLPATSSQPGSQLRPGLPPFRFMVLDPAGRVVEAGKAYVRGQRVSKEILRRARPIMVKGRLVFQVVQIGDPVLTPQDHDYLHVMRNALITGILSAGLIALLLGLVLGKHLSSAIKTLTNAIRSITLDNARQQEVSIRSNDEIGELAAAFNAMHWELTQVHTELKNSHEKVQMQARELKLLSIRDPLTELYNRRHFDQQAAQLFQQAQRYNHPLSVMVGDLDHFKQINDNFSHAIGDEVLRQVAKLLEDGTRKSDLAARYGGEEFVVLFPETDLVAAGQVCEKLRRSIESHPWHELHPKLRVTISIGLGTAEVLENMEKLIALADKNLYLAKQDGRNRVIPEPDLAA